MSTSNNSKMAVKVFASSFVAIILLIIGTLWAPQGIYSILYLSVCALILLTISFFIFKSMAGLWKIITYAVSQIADGRFDLPLHVQSGSEAYSIVEQLILIQNTLKTLAGHVGVVPVDEGKFNGQFKEIFNVMRSSSEEADALKKVFQIADGLNSDAGQLYNSLTQLAQSRDSQESNINNILSDVEICARQTRNDGENATIVGNVAEKAKNNIAVCNHDMQELLLSIDSMKQSTDDISKIIKIIEDIAFQTDIIALNAAVEAARAGVHGKGFSVVAQEVRSLAAKSAEAAKNTRSLISDSVNKITSSANLAVNTASSLQTFVESVNKIHSLMVEINGSTDIQAEAFARANKMLEQMAESIKSSSGFYQQNLVVFQELADRCQGIYSVSEKKRLLIG